MKRLFSRPPGRLAGGTEQEKADRAGKMVRGWARPLLSLRQRNFRLYWCAQLISLIGTFMQTIGQAWLVLQLTHSALALSMVGVFQALPILLFSLVGGVLADLWPKQMVLFVSQIAFLLQALLFWILLTTGTIQLWHIYTLALFSGLVSCLSRPVGSAFIVEMVGREDLPNAVALNSLITQMTRIVGPGLAGIIIAAWGVPLLFLLNTISFLPVIVGLALINRQQLHLPEIREVEAESTARKTKTWQRLKEGLDYIWQTPEIVLLIIVVGLVLLFGANFNVVLPLFATNILQTGASGFGFLSAASGAGALLAALWLAWRNQHTTMRSIFIALFSFCGLELAFALSPIYLLSLLLIAGVSFVETLFAARTITLLQIISPDHLRGRVMSVYILFFDGSLPLGYLLTGWLTSQYGAEPGLIICVLCALLTTSLGTGWWVWRIKPAMFRAFRTL